MHREPSPRRRQALAITLTLGLLGAPALGAAQDGGTARASPRSFDIPAGPLNEAIGRFAAAAGVSVTALSELTAGRRTPGLHGDYPVAEALNLLLAGTGLEAVDQGEGSYTVRALPQTADAATLLQAVKVEAVAERSVTTEGSRSYTSPALTLGKTAQSLREIPQSVSVITRQRMEDQNLVSLEDALARSTGFTVGSNGPGGGPIYVRGFSVDTFQYDGVAQANPDYSFSKPDLVTYDRIEVLRGAAGLLQGAGNPSAAINLVRKRPTQTFAASGTAYAGSWNYYRGEVDVGGPLNASGRLRGRAVVAYEDRDYYIDVAESQKAVLYAIGEYDLTASTRLTAGTNIQRYDAVPMIGGVPRYGDGRPLPLPRSAYVAPAWNDWAFDTEQVFASVEHTWVNGWKAELLLDAAWDSAYAKRTFTTGTNANFSVDPASNDALVNFGSVWDTDIDRQGLEARASGSFSLLGRTHTALAGASYRRNRSAGPRASFGSTAIDDILNFDPWSVPEPENPPFTSSSVSDTEQYGAYGSARFGLSDALTVVLGGRVDWYELTTRTRNLTTGVTTPQPDYSLDPNFTPYAGMVWDLAEQWSLYASYADIFLPQTTQFTREGGKLDPIVGANYEAGIKGELRDGALNVSLAVFRIEQQNRAQEDLAQPCTGAVVSGWCYVAQGEVRSEGVEAEVSGSPLAGWNLLAGYTYNTTKFVKDRVNEGKVFMTQTPKHLLRLWSDYQLPGDWSRLSLGAGINAQSAYYVESGAARAEQSGYAIASARVNWQFSPRMSAALNGNNLFDKTYFAAVGMGYGNVWGDPRNFMLTLRYRL